MANHASAIKAYRQSLKRRLRNKSNATRLRTGLKKFVMLVRAGKMEEAKTSVPALHSLVDKAVNKKVLSKNAAGRYKSRLTRQLNAALASPGKE